MGWGEMLNLQGGSLLGRGLDCTGRSCLGWMVAVGFHCHVFNSCHLCWVFKHKSMWDQDVNSTGIRIEGWVVELEEIDCARGSPWQPGWNQQGSDLISSPGFTKSLFLSTLFLLWLLSFFFVIFVTCLACEIVHPFIFLLQCRQLLFRTFVTLVLKTAFLICSSLLLSMPASCSFL